MYSLARLRKHGAPVSLGAEQLLWVTSRHRRLFEKAVIKLTIRKFRAAKRIKEDTTNDKAKLAERRGRKAAGPRFLREATDDSLKDSKIAGLPISKSSPYLGG